MSGQLYYWVANWNLSRAQAARLLGNDVVTVADGTHENVNSLLALRPAITHFAGYVTGSPNIRWTSVDFDKFYPDDVIKIDQSDDDLPLIADVKWITKDVETGASDILTAVSVAKVRLRAGDDYTIYVEQSLLDSVEQAVHNVGLEPGRIRAYQYDSLKNYDLSVFEASYFTPPAPKLAPTVRAIVAAPKDGETAIVTYDPAVHGWSVNVHTGPHGWLIEPTTPGEGRA